MTPQIINMIAAATRDYQLTPEKVEIAEWDRTSPINSVAAEAVIASLQDPYGRSIPETRPVLLRLRELDVVLALQRCHPVTNAPLYSDADVADVVEWMRRDVLADLIAHPVKLRNALNTALLKRLAEEAAAESQR